MSFNVLIVDDDFINRKLITVILKKHPDLVTNMVEAENGSEALEIMKNNKDINIILLDIFMPVLNGKEFLKIFRSDKENKSIPILVLSTDDAQKRTVLEYGANEFLLKPINENIIISTMNKYLDKQ